MSSVISNPCFKSYDRLLLIPGTGNGERESGNYCTAVTCLIMSFKMADKGKEKTRNLVPRAFSSTIFKMADRREKTLGNAELTPLLIGPFLQAS